MAVRPAWLTRRWSRTRATSLLAALAFTTSTRGMGRYSLACTATRPWSFLYRQLVHGLKDRFRCIALDYPGFGLSTAPAGYGYTIAEHARGRAGVRGAARPARRDADGAGLGRPDRVLGRHAKSCAVPGPRHREHLGLASRRRQEHGMVLEDSRQRRAWRTPVKRGDIFVNVFMRAGIKRRKLSGAERAMYKRPHPTPRRGYRCTSCLGRSSVLTSCSPTWSGVEPGCRQAALIVWGEKDPGFREPLRLRWEQTFPNHRTEILRGASHYIQETRRRTS